ncbi:MAG: nitrite reductase small subunit NirD [Oceanospirillaceae bacterium]|jgi:nitrite reductase (NADH) small subunit|nr:nitrite reductase small subunit NirD [Oceanospirillaceae bacterium]
MNQSTWLSVCTTDDLLAGGGVCVLIGKQQVALFLEPSKAQVFAVSNLDPMLHVESVSRGLMGGIDGQTYVATPLLKHRYELATGRSLDGGDQHLKCWPARILGQTVEVLSAPVCTTEAHHG